MSNTHSCCQGTNAEPLQKSQKVASKDTFVHLHLHSSYSLLDGAIRIPDLTQRLKELQMDSVAVTDHGNLFGVFEFYQAARKANIKPIIGCEFYVAPGKRQEKTNVQGVIDGSNYHLVLLARNLQGYQNMMRLSSRSYIDGFYRKPRIDHELLAEHSQGLICLSACIGGEIQNLAIRGQEKEAEQVAGKFKEIMEPGCFFLELQDHGLKEEKIAAKFNLQLAQALNLPLCLTNDAHYLKPEHQEAQDFLLRINNKKTIQDPLPFSFNSEFYVKSAREMAQLFPDHPEAFLNTQRIAEMIDLQLDYSEPMLPDFPVPSGKDLNSHLYDLARQGLNHRYGSDAVSQKAEILKRFEYEFQTIQKTGFAGYFLIVQDFTNYARQQGIPVGPGRGSAAGSLISYALGITDVDPLRFGLLFERFLNPDRNTLPDIDIDFCTEGREQIIRYVKEKYGFDRVGQIITYSKMTSKACLKDTARVLEIPFHEAHRISEAFPKGAENIKQAMRQSRDFAGLAKKSDTYARLFRVAQELEGNVRQVGIHAAGVVIAPQSLEELVPLAMIRQKDNRILVTQYDMDTLLRMGMVKIDFLGLQNLTIIGETLKLIEERKGKKIHFTPEDPMDDVPTYQTMRDGHLQGIFQLESRGMREFLLRLKPDCFENLIALLALFRPGPLQSGMADAYINRKNGSEAVSYEHPDLEEILESTYGVILFQEQVMEIGKRIGGFSPSEADQLRASMGKKDVSLMAQMKEKFVAGAIAHKKNPTFASQLFDKVAKFAGYGFNKSHSAAYACIVYQTAYLKTHFPVEYMVTILNSSKGKIEDLNPAIRMAQQSGIEVLGPSINESLADFSIVDDQKISFGLSAIKNVGDAVSAEIVAERMQRAQKKFASLDDLFLKLNLRLCNKRVLEALIQSGSLDCFSAKRKYLLEHIEIFLKQIQMLQHEKNNSQTFLTFGENKNDHAGNSILQLLDAMTGQQDSTTEYPLQKRLKMEKEALGFYLSGHPLYPYKNKIDALSPRPDTLQECAQMPDNSNISLPVMLSNWIKKTTKRGQEMAIVTCEDLTGKMIEGIIFPKSHESLAPKIKLDTPVWLKAKVRKAEESSQISLVIFDIQDLAQYLTQTKIEHALHIKFLQNVPQRKEVVNQLKRVLTSASGAAGSEFPPAQNGKMRNGQQEHQVYFHVDDQTIRAGKPMPIDMDTNHTIEKLIEELSRINVISAIYVSAGATIEKKYERQN